MYTVHKQKPFPEAHESLIIGLFDQPVKFADQVVELDEAFSGELTGLVKSGDISAKKKSIAKIHTFGKLASKRLYFVGLGKKNDFTFETLREAFGAVFQAIQKDKMEEAAVYLDSFITEKIDALDAAHALSEALALSTYEFEGYKQKSNEPEKKFNNLQVYSEAVDEEDIKSSLIVGHAFGSGTNSARTLVNTPGNLLTATDLAEYAKELGAKYEFEVEILEKEDMLKLGMGALLAVNQGLQGTT